MKNKKRYIIISIIIIVILTFIIPVKTVYKKVDVGSPISPAICYEKINYNIYGIKIWQK